MANKDSSIVTNLEATPRVMASSNELYGRIRSLVDSIEVAAADNDGDTYTFYPVPLEARILDVLVTNDAITGGTDYDCGFYKITDGNLGAVIDKDILFDGVDISSGNATYASKLFSGTGAVDQANIGQRVWELCAYADLKAARAANPTGQVYLVVTANTVGSGAGTLAIRTDMVVD